MIRKLCFKLSIKSICLFVIVILFLSSCSGKNITNPDYENIWDEIDDNGTVYETLTEEQQAKVDYPEFDENCVYWTLKGRSYHAVDWCYTLSRSKSVKNGTLEEAIDEGKIDPCSKCIGH